MHRTDVQLAAIAESIEELRKARADMIRKRRQQGATLRQIASEARLSHTAVHKILSA